MVVDGLYSDAEIIIAAVGNYVSAFHFVQKKQKELKLEWQLVMDNFNESLRLLEKHQNGHQLLLTWYAQRTHNPKDNIHQFVNALWADITRDHAKVALIANDHFRRCVWEFILGVTLCVASVTSLVLLLPFIANPVILAPVFILTCMMIPLLAHFLMISPGIKDWNAAKTLNKTLSDALPSMSGNRPFRDAFFKEGVCESSKKDIADQYNILDNVPNI